MTSSESYLARYGASMMNTFGTPKRVFVRGEGVYLWDADGRRYLDLLAGLAVNSLGHGHPGVVEAVCDQLATLGHVSNFFATPPQIRLGERLAALVTRNAPSTPAKVFLVNSGTEANEAAFKVTRRAHATDPMRPGRTRLVAMEGAFHGRTSAALALTWNPGYRMPFEPLPGEITFVPYGDERALAGALDDSVAAVVIEPIQGENGVVVPPPDFLAAARSLTQEVGALLWLDEVQTGIGRTGEWLAHLPTGITADLVTVAKGLGAGFPVGACIATGPAAGALGPGSHGTTFGGNPVAARAALAVLDHLDANDVLSHVRRTGEHLARGIESLRHPLVDHVRGAGLLLGVVLAQPVANAVADAALDAGFVINAPRPSILRLAPPLVINPEDLDSFIEALPGLLDRSPR